MSKNLIPHSLESPLQRKLIAAQARKITALMEANAALKEQVSEQRRAIDFQTAAEELEREREYSSTLYHGFREQQARAILAEDEVARLVEDNAKLKLNLEASELQRAAAREIIGGLWRYTSVGCDADARAEAWLNANKEE